jgi:8-oxo-dGTP pyrophosphatase MutT (NUDIX family)
MIHVASIRELLASAKPSEEAEPKAAVAAILRQREQAEILFIKRAEHEKDPWSGHMAFPGGRRDPGDVSLERTAMRETLEEIGLDLARHGERIAQLDDVPTHKTGLIVRPFVWAIAEPPPLILNREVDEVHWVPIEALMSGAHDTTFHLEWGGMKHAFPAYSVGERVVWGLTYRFLQIVFSHLR